MLIQQVAEKDRYKAALEEITSLLLRSDKPHTLHDACLVAWKALGINIEE